MRKIILGLAVSLDNFIEGPHGEYDWCLTDQDYGMTEFLSRVDTVFYGRKSYELMINNEGGLDFFGKKKNYVFSNTLKELPDGAELVSGDIVSAIKEIKAQQGKDIWLFGGASLTSTILQAGLLDEVWLSVHPILLGKGKSLFPDLSERVNLKLIDSKTFNTGLVSLRYEVLH
jgi:dihydrofolate reductase